MAAHQKPTYTDIESWLENKGLLDGPMPANTMVTCACWSALHDNKEAREMVIGRGAFDTFCETVSEIWLRCDRDLAKLAPLAASYVEKEGKLPGESYAELADWARGEGLL